MFTYRHCLESHCVTVNIITPHFNFNLKFQVKADVQQNVTGELVVSGLDSATSLIQTAKNLMNAVVSTVKSSYVASTKYPTLAANEGKRGKKPLVVWKMRAPEKKPLVRRDSPDEVKAKVRRGSQRKPANPMKVLAEFQGPDEMI